MSSTLRAINNLEQICNNRILIQNLKRRIYFSEYKFYLIVRDPEKRLQSFFRDKFRVHPNSFGVNNFEWQYPQILVLKEIGIDLKDKTDSKYKEILLSIEYSDFIKILPQIYMNDGHLIPQHHLLDFYIGKRLLKLKPDRILKMENEDDMKFISKKLNINTGIKVNFTKNQFCDFTLSEKEQNIIAKIYQDDFEKFSYNFL
ncbi:sulfotransferase family protein [Mangrovimonas sp. AS39]|uniref:sulfotransferase family 2 domain-containing protein n=1 Tax=Mangrovimonas futianensis TaxID=2895523 RepID=UPI001E569945|nr:sulfotransferase family 2 domain-containing protein [Mangrovimonas futianensis]MCF1190813.1 sulfotransferase family protein [Mangrovimonas futianensis]MCF1194510.1 sulfotransferase family protein [Mangrovimonas futianensis]